MLLCQIFILVELVGEGEDKTVNEDVDETALAHGLLSRDERLTIESHWVSQVISLVHNEEDHAFEQLLDPKEEGQVHLLKVLLLHVLQERLYLWHR